ncbi:MAG: ANTAR domain-containing protein [Solirubrobacteraceae bacterium]
MGALNSRVIIEQAKGVLSARPRVDVDEAFLRIRAHAGETNRTIGDMSPGT